jgi:hypothetical protein
VNSWFGATPCWRAHQAHCHPRREALLDHSNLLGCGPRNAYRHGLAVAVRHSVKSAAEIDAFASEIAYAATGLALAAADAEIVAFARAAAEAELDLACIRGMKSVAMTRPVCQWSRIIPKWTLLQPLRARSSRLHARPRRRQA